MISITQMQPQHWEKVKAIFEEGIATEVATFETEAPSWESWDREHLNYSRLIASNNDEVVGWAALTPISSRCVYAGVAEVSIYVKASARGNGVGKKLLLELIKDSQQNDLWMLQASVIAANEASVLLHESVGFRKVGYREKLGHYKQKWHDVILLEKRKPYTE